MPIHPKVFKAIKRKNSTELEKALHSCPKEHQVSQRYAALHACIAHGFQQGVTDLIESGIDLNGYYQGATAVHMAYLYRQYEMVRYLYHHGARLDLPLKTEKGGYATHILLLVAKYKEYQEFQWLVKHSPNLINQKNNHQQTPLMQALLCKNRVLSKFMLDYLEPDVNQCDAIGDTPLHIAIDNEWVSITAALCEKGAKTDTKNSFGITPYQLALTKNKSRIFHVVSYYTSQELLSTSFRELVKFDRVRDLGWPKTLLWLVSPSRKASYHQQTKKTQKKQNGWIARPKKVSSMIQSAGSIELTEKGRTSVAHDQPLLKFDKSYLETQHGRWADKRKRKKKVHQSIKISPEKKYRALSGSDSDETVTTEMSEEIEKENGLLDTETIEHSKKSSCCQIM